MIGTLFNTIAVALGASIGLASHKYISNKSQHKILMVFGLFTMALSINMISSMSAPIDIFLALIIGTLLGQTLTLHDRLSSFTSKFDKQSNSNSDSTSSGFIKATMLFCVGGLTLIGCMEEGLKGESQLLFIKGTMDLISSFFLASALGKGVLFSAIGVLIFQGSLTLFFMSFGAQIPDELIMDLTALGGILLLALGIDLMDIKSIKMIDLLPSLIILPIIHFLHTLIVELTIFEFIQ
ncbi:MAG: hypothetical protein COA49_09655 [Bacteroidetes bacterium]|nr:MAG: hypothetical protein COA49_09655 [Bacteroidota bacterium]